MIICFFIKQTALLLSLSTFEVNMTFKKVNKKELNEIIFVKYAKILEKCMLK